MADNVLGLDGSKRIGWDSAERHRLCVNHSYKTGVIIAASLHFVAALPNPHYFEYCVEQGPLRQTLMRQRFLVIDGDIRVPEEPGLGIELDEGVVAKFRIALMNGEAVRVGPACRAGPAEAPPGRRGLPRTARRLRRHQLRERTARRRGAIRNRRAGLEQEGPRAIRANARPMPRVTTYRPIILRGRDSASQGCLGDRSSPP
ncbi:MAG: enolase C-terminal domain-like protein [Gemmataceae bacterium]